MLRSKVIINAPPALLKDQKSCSLGIYVDIHMSDLSQKEKYPMSILPKRHFPFQKCSHTFFIIRRCDQFDTDSCPAVFKKSKIKYTSNEEYAQRAP